MTLIRTEQWLMDGWKFWYYCQSHGRLFLYKCTTINNNNWTTSIFIVDVEKKLTCYCPLTLLDGYSTIDQRDKDCKYKTSDGSADLTEPEPLKVQRGYMKQSPITWPLPPSLSLPLSLLMFSSVVLISSFLSYRLFNEPGSCHSLLIWPSMAQRCGRPRICHPPVNCV